MTEETFGNYAEIQRRYFADGHQGNAGSDTGNRGYDAKMGGLAKPACRFVVSVGVPVRGDLQKKNQRKEGQRERQRSG